MPLLEPAHYWVVLAAAFLALEAFGVPGVGFLFAGLAAAVTGVAVYLGFIESTDYVVQSAAFMAFTGLFAALLWKKLKRWSHAAKGDYQNMIGDLATIGKGGLVKGQQGQANWSGTTMMAELADHAAVETIAENSVVEIVAVKGNTLIVAPKKAA